MRRQTSWQRLELRSRWQLARDRLRGAGVPGRDRGRRVHATRDAGEVVCPGLLTGNRERQVQGVGDFDMASKARTGTPQH
eukprot:2182371-Rhodomonas_salina.1